MTEPGFTDRLQWVLGRIPGRRRRVLDAGCGTGTYTVALATRGHFVTAVDFSEPMLAATQRAARVAGVAHRIRLVRCDLRCWEPAESFDAVLCMGVTEYYADPAAMLRRLYDMTGERLLVSVSAAGVGVREYLRRSWLALHGLQARLYGVAELETALSGLPGAAVSVTEMRWAHCAVADRTIAAPPGAASPARHGANRKRRRTASCPV